MVFGLPTPILCWFSLARLPTETARVFFFLNCSSKRKGFIFLLPAPGGDYLYFITKGGRLFEGGDCFKYFSQEVVP